MHYRDMLAAQSALDNQARTGNEMIEGTVVGNWDPAEGTVECQFGDTAAVFTDQGDSPTTVFANLLTPAIGFQYAPVGGERCLLIRTASGYSALVEHGPDDTPNVPAGETWDLHRNARTGTFDAGWQLQNDAVEGDGLGATVIGFRGAITRLQTKSGMLVELNDITGTLTISTPNGHSIVLDEDPAVTITTASGLIHSLDDASGLIGIGAKGEDLAADQAAIVKEHLKTLSDNIIATTVQTTITQLLDVMVAQGMPSAGLVAAIVQATDWVKNLPGINPAIPDGSVITRIKSSL